MSRSGYIDDFDEQWDLIRWRGAVASAIRGRRGQALLRELLAALDAMPYPRLIAHSLQDEAGDRCALGELGARRGIDLTTLDPDDSDAVAKAFGIAPALAREIVYENDEARSRESPRERWERMRAWVTALLAREAARGSGGGR